MNIRIGASDLLILMSAVFSFSNMPLTITCLSLGVIGAIGRYGVERAEHQAKALTSDQGGERLASIVTNFVENMNKNKDSIH